MTSALGEDYFPGAAETLFDVENDPGEQYNVLGSHPGVAADLRGERATHEAALAADTNFFARAERDLLPGSLGFILAPGAVPGNHYPSLLFRRPFGTNDEQYTAQSSGDLEAWSDIADPPGVVMEVRHNEDGTEDAVLTIDQSIEHSTDNQRYYRMKAEGR
jgi:hypothetical protein